MENLFSTITTDMVQSAYERNGYVYFVKGDYNLNIFGIRSNDDTSNAFNDLIGVSFKVDGEWVLKKYSATTDPGTYYRENPMNVNGTAILAPGQHLAAFKIGKHQGKYRALVQNKSLPLYRDNNKNNVLDWNGKTRNEMAGINIHRATANAGGKSVQVDKWSAGCQVIAAYDDFAEFMDIIDKSAAKYGSTFTYTLFTEQQFFG